MEELETAYTSAVSAFMCKNPRECYMTYATLEPLNTSTLARGVGIGLVVVDVISIIHALNSFRNKEKKNTTLQGWSSVLKSLSVMVTVGSLVVNPSFVTEYLPYSFHLPVFAITFLKTGSLIASTFTKVYVSFAILRFMLNIANVATIHYKLYIGHRSWRTFATGVIKNMLVPLVELSVSLASLYIPTDHVKHLIMRYLVTTDLWKISFDVFNPSIVIDVDTAFWNHTKVPKIYACFESAKSDTSVRLLLSDGDNPHCPAYSVIKFISQIRKMFEEVNNKQKETKIIGLGGEQPVSSEISKIQIDADDIVILVDCVNLGRVNTTQIGSNPLTIGTGSIFCLYVPVNRTDKIDAREERLKNIKSSVSIAAEHLTIITANILSSVTNYFQYLMGFDQYMSITKANENPVMQSRLYNYSVSPVETKKKFFRVKHWDVYCRPVISSTRPSNLTASKRITYLSNLKNKCNINKSDNAIQRLSYPPDEMSDTLKIFNEIWYLTAMNIGGVNRDWVLQNVRIIKPEREIIIEETKTKCKVQIELYIKSAKIERDEELIVKSFTEHIKNAIRIWISLNTHISSFENTRDELKLTMRMLRSIIEPISARNLNYNEIACLFFVIDTQANIPNRPLLPVQPEEPIVQPEAQPVVPFIPPPEVRPNVVINNDNRTFIVVNQINYIFAQAPGNARVIDEPR